MANFLLLNAELPKNANKKKLKIFTLENFQLKEFYFYPSFL